MNQILLYALWYIRGSNCGGWKALRSTANPSNPHSVLQILSANMTNNGVAPGQKAIHEKTNEIPIFQEMLTYPDVEGKTVAADAMHCQRQTCRKIIQRKGNYLFSLKENQPSLLENVCLFFEDANKKGKDCFRTVEKNADTLKSGSAAKS